MNVHGEVIGQSFSDEFRIDLPMQKEELGPALRHYVGRAWFFPHREAI